MSTNATIALKIENTGIFKTIYLHWDGDLAEEILNHNFKTYEKVEELVNRGDLSTINSDGISKSFKDMGEDWINCSYQLCVEEEWKELNQEYNYVFENNKWNKR